MEKIKIDDPRLTPDLKRTRSGSTQQFYTDNWHNILFELKHDRQEMYADLISGEWYWVNGCSKCNGSGEKYSYVVCDKHNVCVECGTHRRDLTDIPWGHADGFLCKPCADKRDIQLRKEAFNKVSEYEYDEDDYRYKSTVVCPHCGSDNGMEWVDYQQTSSEQECGVCHGKYKLEIEFVPNFSTEVIGERLMS